MKNGEMLLKFRELLRKRRKATGAVWEGRHQEFSLALVL